MSGSKISTICFDYYGTLVDIGKPFMKIKDWFYEFINKEKGQVSVEIFNMYFNKQRARYLRSTKFLNGIEILLKSYKNSCDRYNMNAYIKEFSNFFEELFTATVVFADTIDTISRLRKWFSLGLVTNADNIYLFKSINLHSLDFNFIITSENAKSYKPQSMIFEKAIKKAGVSSDKILMVGDSLTEDIIPAKELGFQTIWINQDKDQGNYDKVLRIRKLNELLKYV